MNFLQYKVPPLSYYEPMNKELYHKIIMLGCLFLLITSSIGTNNDPLLPEDYAKIVQEHFANEEWEEGKTLLEEGLGRYPKVSDLQWLMGKYWHHKKDYDQARYHLIKAIEDNYNNVNAKQLLVDVEENTQNYSSAICYVNELLEVNPYWRGLWRRKIDLYRKQGNDVEVFSLFTLGIIFAGVRNGVERVSKVMMPVLVVLSLVIAGYSVTRPGALAGVKYFLVPNPKNFSWMTVVTAMGQMFYSLSIAMGILVTFGSYMKKDVSIEESTENVEVFDTAIAIMAGLMIIPAVFAFSGGDPDTLQAGPALMFITIPKVFASMGLGTVVGVLFFVLVLFAAITSSIALTESAVSTFEDELGWDRTRSTVLIGAIMVALGSLSALGYGPLAGVTVFGMQFLDFFDFLTNSVMMPIAAIATCLLVSRVIGVEQIAQEVEQDGQRFRRKPVFNFMIRWLCPIFAAIILASSVANALGWIAM